MLFEERNGELYLQGHIMRIHRPPQGLPGKSPGPRCLYRSQLLRQRQLI